MLKRRKRGKHGKNPKPGWLTKLVRGKRKCITHLRLKGPIGVSSSPAGQSLSMAMLEEALVQAFSVPGLSAVALSINSPGGSPVQSNLIFNRIRQLSDTSGVKVLVFCEDAAASGGYYLAVAGDEIYADRSSVVGSIGVIAARFGVVEAMKKLGVERRINTAGKNKSILDPFEPEKKQDVAHLNTLLQDMHEAFKDVVKSRRGEKLKGKEDELFSGLFWAGEKALEKGLIDGIGAMDTIVRERFGDDVIIKQVEIKKPFPLGRFLGSGAAGAASSLDEAAGAAGGAAMERALTLAEERALWSRYGL